MSSMSQARPTPGEVRLVALSMLVAVGCGSQNLSMIDDVDPSDPFAQTTSSASPNATLQFEFKKLSVVASSGDPVVLIQPHEWGGSGGVRHDFDQDGDFAAYRFDVPAQGLYRLNLEHVGFHDHGMFVVSVDGVPVGLRADGYSPNTTARRFALGQRPLAAGAHRIEFRAAGTHAQSTGRRFAVGLRRLEAELLKRPPPRIDSRAHVIPFASMSVARTSVDAVQVVSATEWAPSGGVRIASRAAGDWAIFSFAAPSAGPYRVLVEDNASSDRGIYALMMNGQAIAGGLDGYLPQSEKRLLDAGEVTFSRPGMQELAVRIEGKDSRSAGHTVGLARLILEPAGLPSVTTPPSPVPAPPSVRREVEPAGELLWSTEFDGVDVAFDRWIAFFKGKDAQTGFSVDRLLASGADLNKRLNARVIESNFGLGEVGKNFTLETRKAPLQGSTSYLFAQLDDIPINANMTRGRINIEAKRIAPAGNEEFYFRWRVMIHPEFNDEFPHRAWYQFLELGSGLRANGGHTLTLGFGNNREQVADGRVGFSFVEHRSYVPTSGPLTQQSGGKWVPHWVSENKTIPLPVGRWFDLDLYVRWGLGGRVIVAFDGKVVHDEQKDLTQGGEPKAVNDTLVEMPIVKFYGSEKWNTVKTPPWRAYDSIRIWRGFKDNRPR